MKLVDDFPLRAFSFLFQPPTLSPPLSWLVPRRFDEGWGTWHAKIYGADDELILSGCVVSINGSTALLMSSYSANLNRTYFTNRQDRYIHIKGHSELADYCFDYLKVFRQFSWRLGSKTSDIPVNPEVALGSRIERARIRPRIQDALGALNEKHRHVPSAHGETVIFPYAQSGPLGLVQEEGLMDAIFSCNDQLTRMFLTTGYFALSIPYQRRLIESPINCRVLVASPQVSDSYHDVD